MINSKTTSKVYLVGEVTFAGHRGQSENSAQSFLDSQGGGQLEGLEDWVVSLQLKQLRRGREAILMFIMEVNY